MRFCSAGASDLTNERDFPLMTRDAQLELIGEGDGLEKGKDLMEPVGPHSPHLEVQIDLCGRSEGNLREHDGHTVAEHPPCCQMRGAGRIAFDSRGWRFYTRDVQQEILEVFVEAVRQVFRETDIEIESVDAGDEKGTEDSVITSVGLTGDLKGIFMIRTDTASTAAILRAMTGGVRITLERDRLSEMQMAALGELTNQISGRAITLLFNRPAALRHHPARGHRGAAAAEPRSESRRLLQSHHPGAIRAAHRLSGPAGILSSDLGKN